MPAVEIFFLARLIRWPIVVSCWRNTLAISGVVSWQMVRSVSATCDSGESAGWQQVNSNRSRSSPGGAGAAATRSESNKLAAYSRWWRVASRRNRSTALLRATVVSQAPGLSGMPSRGHASAAARAASCSASSARSMSSVSRMRVASTRPPSTRISSASGSI